MQTLSVSAQTFLDALNLFLVRVGEPITLSPENAVFAREGDVSYEPFLRRVASSCVLSFGQFEAALPTLLAHGPGWLHGNILPIADAVPLVGPRYLVVLEIARGGGCPAPAFNASHELDKAIVIGE